MIVDDKRLLIGSANLNDRSLWGSRDSELVSYIQGEEDLKITVNDKFHTVNQQIHNFRSEIFMEHFGFDREEVRDPCSEAFWIKAWNRIEWNTKFYENVFKVYPSNLYKTWFDLKNRTKNNYFDQDGFEHYKASIKGHAVCYPYNFLCKERLLNAKQRDFSLLLLPIRALY